jgi:hypothetical protein
VLSLNRIWFRMVIFSIITLVLSAHLQKFAETVSSRMTARCQPSWSLLRLSLFTLVRAPNTLFLRLTYLSLDYFVFCFFNFCTSCWQLIGSPEDHDLGFLRSDNARRYIRQLPRYPRKPLAQKYPNLQPAAVDLIEHMLRFDPAGRITGQSLIVSIPLAGLSVKHDDNCFYVFWHLRFWFSQTMFNRMTVVSIGFSDSHLG